MPTQTNGILDGWRLVCPRCHSSFDPAPYPAGCPVCREQGRLSGLLVTYDELPSSPPPTARTSEGLWKAAAFLPKIDATFRRSLGEGDTPLVKIPALGEEIGCEHLYLKLEISNPTGAHKDRFHAVSVAVAAALGATGVVSASTGNHGLSMSAYAALHGLRAAVVCHPKMPVLHQRAIRAVGGLPLLLPPVEGQRLMRLLVQEAGWHPSTTTWQLPVATPYGVEGYKTIAFELFHDLGGRLPDLIYCPSAAGDGLVGLWRGAIDLQRIGVTEALPHLVACQPSGAAPLVAAFTAGLSHVPCLPSSASRALSIADPVSGDLALDAIRVTNGFALAVTDDEIVAARRLLARHGIMAELSSAASLAGAIKALAVAPEQRTRTIVCLITSSGLKWLDDADQQDDAITFDRAETALAAVHHH